MVIYKPNVTIMRSYLIVLRLTRDTIICIIIAGDNSMLTQLYKIHVHVAKNHVVVIIKGGAQIINLCAV